MAESLTKRLLWTQIVVSPLAFARIAGGCALVVGVWLAVFQPYTDRITAFHDYGLDRLPSGAGDALMAYLKARGFNPRQDYGLPPHVQQYDGQYGATPLRVETRYVDMGPKGGDIEASVIWSGRGWYG